MEEKELVLSEEWWKIIESKRKEYRITQGRLALHLGISSGHYRNMRNGIAPLTEEMKEKIETMLERLNPDAPLSLLIDYVRIRFPSYDSVTMRTIAEELLKIPFEEGFEKQSHGWNNYENCFAYGNIFLCSSCNSELGILLEMRGQGCRQFELYLEHRAQSWIDFFEHVNLFDGVYKRLDLAVNDAYGILDVSYLAQKCENGECISKSRKFSVCGSGELRFEKFAMGKTLYIGSRQSEVYFCIYEKDYEQYIVNDIPIEEAVIKNRFEIRLADERADEAVHQLIVKRYEEDFIETVVFGIINHYIRFAVRDDEVKKTLWENDLMWQHFIGCYRDKLRLATEPKPFSRRRTLNWVSRQCMPTIMGLVADDIQKGTTDIEDMMNNAEPSLKMQKMLGLERRIVEELKVKINEKGKVKFYCENKEDKK